MFAALRRNVTWWAILVAGLAGGTVHLLVNIVLMPLWLGISPALFLRYVGALVLGPDVLVGSGAGVVFVGLVVHYILSLIMAAVIALVVHRWGMLVGLVGGAILGLAFYGINYYTLTLFFPWFFAANTPIILFISHLLFGLTAGGVYEWFDQFDLPINGEDISTEHITNHINEEQSHDPQIA